MKEHNEHRHNAAAAVAVKDPVAERVAPAPKIARASSE